MAKKNYYKILGVSRTASPEEISAAKNRLAKKYHPDMNPGDKEAEKKFKEASEAYAVLSDPEKRQKYDQFGHAAFDGGAGGAGGFGGFDFSGADFSDIFGDIFGDLFGGGSGAGVNIQPVAFLVVKDGCVRTIQLSDGSNTVDRALTMLPELVDKVSALLKKEEKKDAAAPAEQ